MFYQNFHNPLAIIALTDTSTFKTVLLGLPVFWGQAAFIKLAHLCIVNHAYIVQALHGFMYGGAHIAFVFHDAVFVVCLAVKPI